MAFISPLGKFEFVKMPFGLKGAPATFQRLMDTILADCRDHAKAYIDDVAIFSMTWRDHIEHLKDVFQHLRQADLKVK